MVAIAQGLDTIIVRVTLARTTTAERRPITSSGDDVSQRSYLALVYSRIDQPVHEQADLPSDEPREWAKEPLVGVQPFVVDWVRYSEYLGSFVEGGKQAELMRERLFETLPGELSALLQGGFAGDRPSRIWFESDAPELVELPWELLAHQGGRRTIVGSFVRGLPPEGATPLVPITDGLRLALVDPASRAPHVLTETLLESQIQGLEVISLAGDLRSALRQAVHEGFELVHLIANGSVTSSLDGVLEFPGSDDLMSAREMASFLHGSRVRVLGLTPCAGGDQPSTWIGSRMVPSSHRAFAYFAASSYPMPSIIAPLGPLNDDDLRAFWSTLYAGLASRNSLEDSMASAQAGRSLAVALFLHQLQVPTFRWVDPAKRPSEDPLAAHADLTASRELASEIENLKKKAGLETTALDAFTERESARQSLLEAAVSDWVEGVEEA
jgi:hypothetical protein